MVNRTGGAGAGNPGAGLAGEPVVRSRDHSIEASGRRAAQAVHPSPGVDSGLSRVAIYVLLALAVIILGMNWPLLAIGLDSMTPIWMAFFRVAGAALAVGSFLAATGRITTPPRSDWPMILAVSIFRLATLMVLVFFALKLVPAGRSSVLVWTASLWTVPVAAIFLKAKMTARRWTGLLIGLSGVILLSEVWENDWQQPEVLLGTGLLLTGAIINASTSVYIRGHDWTMDPIQALPWQMGLAAVPLLILALAVDGPPQIDWTAELSLIMAYQAVLASGVAFLAQVVVLRNISAVSANLTMMGIPVIGVVSSAAFLGEQVTVAVVLGMMLIMTGVMVNVLGEVQR